MKLLILDSGHAKNTAGKKAPDNSFYEWSFNNDMQYKIKKRAEDHGIHVFLSNPTPNTTSDIGLSERATKMNNYWISKNKPKSIMISLHANAYGDDFNAARGSECYVANNASNTSKNFAKILNDNVVAAMKKIDSGAKDRGVKTNNFTVIYKSSMPCCLMEYAFYSNKEDLKILKNNKDELVEATIKAICSYFDITYKPVVVNVSGKYRVVCGSYGSKDNAVAMQDKLKTAGFSSFLIFEEGL